MSYSTNNYRCNEDQWESAFRKIFIPITALNHKVAVKNKPIKLSLWITSQLLLLNNSFTAAIIKA